MKAPRTERNGSKDSHPRTFNAGTVCVASHEENKGVHWGRTEETASVQGTDFYVMRHKLASGSTIQNSTTQLLDSFKFLDVNLANVHDTNGCITTKRSSKLTPMNVVVPQSKNQSIQQSGLFHNRDCCNDPDESLFHYHL